MYIRNFSIIAHIDHGKSTLADRLIQRCGGLSEREMSQQVLDSMDLERERGITIKAQSVALKYRPLDGQHEYLLNVIDTPGHVDFSYEVSRSLAACEGALLVVDAAQGIEAQSISACMSALEQGLEILPVMNKIDLSTADPQRVGAEIDQLLGPTVGGIPQISAKLGIGIEELLQEVIQHVPPPSGSPDRPLRALVIDSSFDNYHGVVSLVRIVDGTVALHDPIRVMSTGQCCQVAGLGVYTPHRAPRQQLHSGEVGYLLTGVKDIHAIPVGDTLCCGTTTSVLAPLPGFKRIKPRVFAGLFPVDASRFGALREALGRLSLNDSALQYEPENSRALGPGFRAGFLGSLHLEIVQERLFREYGLEPIATTPTVAYEVVVQSGETLLVDNPAKLPEYNRIREIREPIMQVELLTPREYIGDVMELCTRRRGKQMGLHYPGGGRQASIRFELPLGEIVLDFFDRLKSLTRGHASYDYDFLCFRATDAVKLEVHINGEAVDALSSLVHRQSAATRGRRLAVRMRELIPRQMFDVAVQAVVGSRVIARETVKALRKNVTAKCYGGDVSRKRKLLDKQKAGKRRMKQLGNVQVPQEAFMAVLRTDQGK